MLMTMATPEMRVEWENTWCEYKDRLKPNRKTGQEIVDFLLTRYQLIELFDNEALYVVIGNVLGNEPFYEKLKQGKSPSPRAFIISNSGNGRQLYENQDDIFEGSEIFVGVDIESGFYCAEGSSLLWDELCAFQGLDEIDLENCYCVAQYISCLERFNLLNEILCMK